MNFFFFYLLEIWKKGSNENFVGLRVYFFLEKNGIIQLNGFGVEILLFFLEI